METDRSFALTWDYCSQDQSVEELRDCVLCVSMELENAKVAARQELRMRDDQLFQLRGLIERTLQERDEAQEKYRKVLLENLLLQQQMTAAHPVSGVSTIEDEPRNGGFSSSNCEDSIVISSPVIDPTRPPPSLSPASSLDSLLAPEKPLPEKGKLLQAVMKAGPLLQTLLLAGPLPQWQRPPPPLESSEIPPVRIQSPPPPPRPVLPQDSMIINTNSSSSSSNNTIASCGRPCSKRGISESLFDFLTAAKYRRVALP